MRRILGGLAALALSFTGLLGGTAVPAQAHTTKVAPAPYAALGDSYAAGYGLPSKSDPASVLCARSNLAYPELLNGRARLKDLDFLACSGATTYDVLTDQLAQVDATTRTITVTIGGNDIGFSQLACLQVGCDLSELVGAVPAPLAALAGGPPAVGLGGDPVVGVAALLGSIQAKAPHAKIYITGYPELFGTRGTFFASKVGCPVPVAQRTAVNGLVQQLNAVIKGSAAAARAGGVNVTYVGVAKAFDGHGLCDTKVPYLSTVLHPNLLGQLTYARALTIRGVAR